jgi:chemotaxis protein MotB
MGRRKKGGHAGGHGWFVTFADLMALLMSFFVVVAAFSSQEKEKFYVVAGAMRDAFGTQKETFNAGIFETDGLPTRAHLKNVDKVPVDEASDITTPNKLKRREEGSSQAKHDRGFGLAAASLRQALNEMPDIAEVSRNIIITESKDGLNISLVDQDGRSMFADGSVTPFERTRKVLEKIAPVVRRMPNRIMIVGHTSATKPGARSGLSLWDLSTGRASSVRELLSANSVPDDRFSSVTGKADTDPMFPDNPYLSVNRRVTITLMSEAPPLPFGAKP